MKEQTLEIFEDVKPGIIIPEVVKENFYIIKTLVKNKLQSLILEIS